MICIPRLTDKIPVKVGDMKLFVSPLSVDHKMKIASFTKMDKGEERPDALKIALHTIKYALKGMEGVCNLDGTPYQLDFESDGSLTDTCLSEISNVLNNDKLAAACISVGNGNLDFKIEGVEIEVPKQASKKK